ncbi:MAG TPA: hypothetical protein VKX41_21620 [Alloacidobacterium sp.]|jgi:hypothetical protein|nr:hypothetical protein [Alloacidobacterium sp.]
MAALKGAFLNFGAGLLGALPNIVVFQFNPAQVSRTPAIPRRPQPCTNAGATSAKQQPCPPSESMSFTLRVDATDLLAQGNPIAAASGILPTLSALEMLMVPQSSLSLNLLSLSGSSGSHQSPPSSLPTVLFFWGPFRIFPVAITSLSVTETEYDTLLNPIRADVSVNLDILQPNQLAGDTLGNAAYNYSQGVKETMAALNLAFAVQFGVSSSLSFSL